MEQQVSIHAPWEGCDSQGCRPSALPPRFNSRTLGRVRLRRSVAYAHPRSFQFTHPGKGATKDGRATHRGGRVSIHAPWEGCDSPATPRRSRRSCFNSRTLGRVRHIQFHSAKSEQKFQFTHPGKGATIHISEFDFSHSVSIHAPWEGCDGKHYSIWAAAEVFQFTHPGKGATSSRCIVKPN